MLNIDNCCQLKMEVYSRTGKLQSAKDIIEASQGQQPPGPQPSVSGVPS